MPRATRARILLAGYLLLLLVSFLVQQFAPVSRRFVFPAAEPEPLEIPAMTREGPLPGRTMRLGWRAYTEARASSSPPVILIHGSPGQAGDFGQLAPLLEAQGRSIFAFDMPGFGHSDADVPDYSARAYARAVLAAMDEIGVERAHLVGWSNGGGVILHIADIAPERVASLTLMAAIGDQAAEGSGSYHFEHFKYAFGYAALVVAPRFVPHFGLYPQSLAHAFIRNFWDTDQRPCAIMQRLHAPTLILHGRYDFLVAPAAAELHHRLIPGSRLVMTGADHFFPFMHADLAARELGEFFDLVEADLPTAGTYNLAPHLHRAGLTGLLDRALDWLRWRQWPLTLAIVLVLLLLWFAPARAFAAFLVATGTVDLALACIAVFLADLWKRRRRRFPPLRRFLLRPAAMILGFIALRLLTHFTIWPLYRELGLLGLVPGLALFTFIAFSVPRLWTWESRQRLKASFSRARHHEFWPARIFYAPLGPWLAFQALRRRGPLVFTAVNPGIENGGGLVGESKYAIMQALGTDPALLPTALIPAGPEPAARARQAWERIESDPALGGLPLILKPDNAQRGYAVKLARSRDDLERYFGDYTRDVILQKFHPGPHEVGIFWIRDPLAASGAPAGRIFSITLKEFTFIEGDGTSTLRRLILAHPRYRCQADVFLARFATRLTEVLPRGERLRLAEAGNHAQGTLFRDGAHLITPALEARIDAIASGFCGRGGGAFDFGRFDVRYASEADLRAGTNLGIVELNGTLSESTNIYDPARSAPWAYRTLFRQWERLYTLGAWRRDQGVRPMTIPQLISLVRGFHRNRPGSAVSD